MERRRPFVQHTFPRMHCSYKPGTTGRQTRSTGPLPASRTLGSSSSNSPNSEKSGELDGDSADGALHLGLHPLEEAAVVEEVAAGGELAAVEEFGEADGAGLVGGGGAAAEEAVELLHQLGVAAVLADRPHQHLHGGEGGVEDGEDPHVVEDAHLVEQRAEEQPREVVEVPHLHRTARDLLHQFQLVGRLDLVDVLVVVAQDVLLRGRAAQKQEGGIDQQHQHGEHQQVHDLHVHSREHHLGHDEQSQAHHHQPPRQHLRCLQQVDRPQIVGVAVQQRVLLHLQAQQSAAHDAHAHVAVGPEGQVEHVPVDLGEHQDHDGEVVEGRVLEGGRLAIAAGGGHAQSPPEDAVHAQLEQDQSQQADHHPVEVDQRQREQSAHLAEWGQGYEENSGCKSHIRTQDQAIIILPLLLFKLQDMASFVPEA